MASAGQALAAPSGFFGVNTIFAPTDADLAGMGRAHAGVLREPFGWSELEPTPGTYHFAYTGPSVSAAPATNFDRVVAGAASQGVTVLPFVFGTPPWARDCSGIPDFFCDRVTPLRSPEGAERWPELFRALVDRYGPNGTLWTDPNDAYSPPYRPIRTWQIWNEPNSATYFRPKPQPKAYYQLLKLASEAIHSRDPGAQVMLSGLYGGSHSPSPPDGMRGIPLGRFLDQLYKFKHAKRFFDGVAVHPYSPNIKNIADQLRRTRQVMGDHGDRKTPLFLSELGWGSDTAAEGGSSLYKGLAGQSQMLTKTFKFALRNRQRYRLQGVTWFSWRDLTPDKVGNCLVCASFGLLTADGSAKPALGAFTSFTGGQP